MKRKWTTILLFFIGSFLNAQNLDTINVLKFKVKAKKDETGELVLQNRNLRTEFTIKGSVCDKYSIEIVDMKISILSKFENSSWNATDTFLTECYFSDTNELFLPSFEVTDFNEDGYQDLTCWTKTNINGNQWMYLFLFNPQLNKLVRLKNTAESHWKGYTDIWDNPIYESKDTTINCFCASGAYGVSFASKYKLINFNAIPIEKEENNMTGEKLKTSYYIGLNGYWVLKKNKKKINKG